MDAYKYIITSFICCLISNLPVNSFRRKLRIKSSYLSVSARLIKRNLKFGVKMDQLLELTQTVKSDIMFFLREAFQNVVKNYRSQSTAIAEVFGELKELISNNKPIVTSIALTIVFCSYLIRLRKNPSENVKTHEIKTESVEQNSDVSLLTTGPIDSSSSVVEEIVDGTVLPEQPYVPIFKVTMPVRKNKFRGWTPDILRRNQKIPQLNESANIKKIEYKTLDLPVVLKNDQIEPVKELVTNELQIENKIIVETEPIIELQNIEVEVDSSFNSSEYTMELIRESIIEEPVVVVTNPIETVQPRKSDELLPIATPSKVTSGEDVNNGAIIAGIIASIKFGPLGGILVAVISKYLAENLKEMTEK